MVDIGNQFSRDEPSIEVLEILSLETCIRFTRNIFTALKGMKWASPAQPLKWASFRR